MHHLLTKWFVKVYILRLKSSSNAKGTLSSVLSYSLSLCVLSFTFVSFLKGERNTLFRVLVYHFKTLNMSLHASRAKMDEKAAKRSDTVYDRHSEKEHANR